MKAGPPTVLGNALMGLRELIASETYGPGDKLPSQQDLCEQLQVSPSSLREAVKMLAALGVLESRHGSGVYVSDLSPEQVIGSLSLSIGLLPLDNILDLYETRRVLEGHTAAKAAAIKNEPLRSRMVRLVDAMEATPDSAQWSEMDALFHDTIAEIAGNESTRALLRLLRVRNRGYHAFFAGEKGMEMRRLSEVGHRQILDAIIAGDPLAANNAISHHIIQTEQWVRRGRPSSDRTEMDGSIADVRFELASVLESNVEQDGPSTESNDPSSH